jgi:hypothetical protein
MEYYIDLDKWAPEKLTMKVNGKSYPVKDITMAMFIEILSLCQLGIGNDKNLNDFINQARKNAKGNKIKAFFENAKTVLRGGKPISERAGRKKLFNFIRKVVPSLPVSLLRAMSQIQIEEFMKFLVQTYWEGQNDPNFQKPMAGM